MSTMSDKRCAACRGESPRVAEADLSQLCRRLDDGWRIVDGHHLEKEYTFPDFGSALAFTTRVGEAAESEGHHPEIHLAWGVVRLKLWTVAIDGLTESDFLLAEAADRAQRAA